MTVLVFKTDGKTEVFQGADHFEASFPPDPAGSALIVRRTADDRRELGIFPPGGWMGARVVTATDNQTLTSNANPPSLASVKTGVAAIAQTITTAAPR